MVQVRQPFSVPCLVWLDQVLERLNFLGQEIQKMPAQKIVAGGLSQVPEGRHVFPGLTVMENLEMGAFLKKNREENQANLKKVFSRFPRLEERKNQDAALFQGENNKCLPWDAPSCQHQKLLLLDEPSMGLAPIFIQEIFDIIKISRSKEQPSS